MIQINKQLERPDKGPLASGSLIAFDPKFNKADLTVIYYLTHWYSQAAIDEGFKSVAGVTNFKYVQVKKCTEAEYLKLNDAGAADLVELWLLEIIEELVGTGNAVIV